MSECLNLYIIIDNLPIVNNSLVNIINLKRIWKESAILRAQIFAGRSFRGINFRGRLVRNLQISFFLFIDSLTKSVFLNWKISKFWGTNFRGCSIFCKFRGTYFGEFWPKSRKIISAKICFAKTFFAKFSTLKVNVRLMF